MNQERVMIESVLKEEITKVNSENVDSIDVNEIDMDASLSEYCDSLDRVEVAINLEVRLNIKINDDIWGKLSYQPLRDSVEYLMELMN